MDQPLLRLREPHSAGGWDFRLALLHALETLDQERLGVRVLLLADQRAPKSERVLNVVQSSGLAFSRMASDSRIAASASVCFFCFSKFDP